MASKTEGPNESLKLVNTKASQLLYNCGISSQGTIPKNCTRSWRPKSLARRSHTSRISPSPAIRSLTFDSFTRDKASSANGNAFLICSFAAQSSLSVSPFLDDSWPLEKKLDGIPVSKNVLTSLAPKVVSNRCVSLLVARTIEMDLAALRIFGAYGSSLTRTLR